MATAEATTRLDAGPEKFDDDRQKQFGNWSRNFGESALFALGYAALIAIIVSVFSLHPIEGRDQLANAANYVLLFSVEGLLIWALATMLIFGHETRVQDFVGAFAMIYLLLSIVRLTFAFVAGIEILIVLNKAHDLPTFAELASFYGAVAKDLVTADLYDFATAELNGSSYAWGGLDTENISWPRAIIHVYKLSVFFTIVWAWHKWLHIGAQKRAQRSARILANNQRNNGQDAAA